MIVEKLCIFTSSVDWKFLHFLYFLVDNNLFVCCKLCCCVHIEVTAFQTVNTLPDFNSWNIFSLSFILKKLIKDSFEFIDQSYLLEILFQFIDSHSCNWNNFFLLIWESCAIFVIFTVVHSVKTLEELCQFITDVVETENKDLEVRPYLVEVRDKVMRVFGHFLNWSKTRLDVKLYKTLNVLPNKFVDSDFVSCGWFFGGEFEYNSKF